LSVLLKEQAIEVADENSHASNYTLIRPVSMLIVSVFRDSKVERAFWIWSGTNDSNKSRNLGDIGGLTGVALASAAFGSKGRDLKSGTRSRY